MKKVLMRADHVERSNVMALALSIKSMSENRISENGIITQGATYSNKVRCGRYIRIILEPPGLAVARWRNVSVQYTSTALPESCVSFAGARDHKWRQ